MPEVHSRATSENQARNGSARRSCRFRNGCDSQDCFSRQYGRRHNFRVKVERNHPSAESGTRDIDALIEFVARLRLTVVRRYIDIRLSHRAPAPELPCWFFRDGRSTSSVVVHIKGRLNRRPMKKKTIIRPKRTRSARNQRFVAGKRSNGAKKNQAEPAPPPWLRMFPSGSDSRPH